MIPDRFSGDPRILIGPAGADLDYEGGQPVMDAGLENQALLSLFTRPGWCGNVFLPKAEQIGSDFETTAEAALTLQGLADIQNAAERALKSDLFPELAVAVTNPQSWDVRVVATLGPGVALTLDRRGMLWSAQAASPASGRLVKHL
jgi:hypothetical protein